jgi:RNA-binding protein
VVVGSAGLSDGVVAQVDEELRRRELVKVKMPPGPDRKALPGVLAERLGAELISLVGRSAVLWRANPDADAPVGETD